MGPSSFDVGNTGRSQPGGKARLKFVSVCLRNMKAAGSPGRVGCCLSIYEACSAN